MAGLSIFTVAIVEYVLVAISFIMTAARMAYTIRTKKRWTTEDGWLAGVLCCFVGIWYSAHILRGHGTNNVAHPELLSPVEIWQREDGSKRALLGRFCCATAYVSLAEIRRCGG